MTARVCGGLSLSQPELVGDESPVWVELVVANARGDEVDATVVDHRDPRSLVDEPVIECRPHVCGRSWVRRVERARVEVCAVNSTVAEPPVVEALAAGEPGGEEAIRGVAPAGWDQLYALEDFLVSTVEEGMRNQPNAHAVAKPS